MSYYKIVNLLVIISLLNSCMLYKKHPTSTEEYTKCMPTANEFDTHRMAGNKYIFDPSNVKKPLAEKCSAKESNFANTTECVQYREDFEGYKKTYHKQCKSTSFRDEHMLLFGPLETPFVIIGGVIFGIFFIPFCLFTKCYEQ